MADEFFRASYTTGFWASGDITGGLHYKAMLGNNLSQLGVDAGQLDDGFDTFSGALWWTGGGFGTNGPFGDFEHHENVATSFGASFSRSNETRQSQPGKEDPENTQIRLTDGTAIFDVSALAGLRLRLANLRRVRRALGAGRGGELVPLRNESLPRQRRSRLCARVSCRLLELSAGGGG